MLKSYYVLCILLVGLVAIYNPYSDVDVGSQMVSTFMIFVLRSLPRVIIKKQMFQFSSRSIVSS